jgi:hypothetical protein
VKTNLMNIFAASGNSDIEGVDNINACYGGERADQCSHVSYMLALQSSAACSSTRSSLTVQVASFGIEIKMQHQSRP